MCNKCEEDAKIITMKISKDQKTMYKSADNDSHGVGGTYKSRRELVDVKGFDISDETPYITSIEHTFRHNGYVEGNPNDKKEDITFVNYSLYFNSFDNITFSTSYIWDTPPYGKYKYTCNGNGCFSKFDKIVLYWTYDEGVDNFVLKCYL